MSKNIQWYVNPSRVTLFYTTLTATWGVKLPPSISQVPVQQLLTKFQRLYPCFRGVPLTQRCYTRNITGSCFQPYIQDGGCQTGNTFISAEEQLPVILSIVQLSRESPKTWIYSRWNFVASSFVVLSLIHI